MSGSFRLRIFRGCASGGGMVDSGSLSPMFPNMSSESSLRRLVLASVCLLVDTGCVEDCGC